MLKKVEELTNRINQLEKLEEENKILQLEISTLKQENSELKLRINSNSSNSSKPPSSDGYKKKPAFPKQRKGKQGGQKGHKGQTLKQVINPDRIVKCIPDACTCGHKFTNEQVILSETRQVFDLPQPHLEVTEYQIHKSTCPVCGILQKGAVPENVNAPVQYGDKVKAYVVFIKCSL